MTVTISDKLMIPFLFFLENKFDIACTMSTNEEFIYSRKRL